MKTVKPTKTTGLKLHATATPLLLCWPLLIGNALLAAPPPVITLQPASQTVPIGGTATFSVEATSGTKLSYQWYFEAAAIAGATASTYTVTNAQATHAGVYYVAVQNAGGRVNSSNAILGVIHITVTPTAGLLTTEDGGTASFSVVLNAAPTANVVVPISSSNTGEGTVSVASLTFTPANWSTPRTVTVTGVDDDLADGFQPYSVVLAPASSSDANYNGLDPADVQVANSDNDIDYGLITVDTTSDVSDGNMSSLAALAANRGADGAISLREAITAANKTANSGGRPDRIYFNIAGTGVHTIVPSSALPAITNAVVIDGWSEPDFAGTPVIELNGTNAGAGVSGLTMDAGSSGSTIRGVAVNSFSEDGVQVMSASNVVAGNFIGTDASGLLDRGNTNDGIVIADAANNTIGGLTAAERNVISGNGLGIRVGGSNASGNIIIGNYIGANSAGAPNLGNRLHGVYFSRYAGAAIGDPHDNRVGGTMEAEGNLIVNNGAGGGGWDGICLYNTPIVKNAILGNSIYANGDLGIDLATNGVTANDLGDGDNGPNNSQNFPVLSSAYTHGSLVTIAGTLNSKANSAFRVEFFANTAPNPSGYGEGARYLGFVNVRTDPSGNAAVDTTLAATVAAGEFVSATATKSDSAFMTFSDTSEFSSNVTAVLPADIVTVMDGPARVASLANFTYTIAVSNQGPSAASSVVVFATLSSNLTFVGASAGGTYLGGVVTWPAVASLGAGSTTNLTVTVRSPVRGMVKSSASSTSATWDPNLTDNDGSDLTAQVSTTVTPLAIANTSSGANVATLNWSHTISPGSARILIVGVSIDDPTTTVIAATFANLLPLTPIGHTNGTQTKVLMYYLLNPPVGTFPISISLDTSAGIVGGAVSFNGASQANPIAAFAGNTGTGTNASVTVGSSFGGVVVDTVAPKSPARANFAGPEQTIAWNLFSGTYSGAGSSTPGEDSVSPSWKLTGAAPAWAMGAVALNPAIVLADITLTVTGPASVVATSNLTCTLTVTNLGPDPATNLVVSDVLPAGATFVSASSGGTLSGGVVRWPALTNFVRGAKTNYTVIITAPCTGPLTNMAFSTASTAEPDPSNNNGTGKNNRVITTVVPIADVATTVTGPGGVLAAANFSYTITVANAGPSPASDVLVSDTLPAGATFVSASDDGTDNAGVVTWPPLAILPSGGAASFTVTVTAPASGTLTNTVASTSATTDLVPSNNNGSAAAARAVTVIFPPASLTGRLLPGGAFRMELHTLPNSTCTFLASTNLVDWIMLVTTNSGDGFVVFIDQDVLIYPQRFYRSMQTP